MKPRVSNQKTAALTLVEVLVVIFVVAVLALVISPAVIPDRPRKSPRISCVNNLKQVGLAYLIWAGDHNDKFPMQVSVTNDGTMELTADGRNAWLNFLVMSNELNTPKILWCPADKDRVVATNFTHGFSSKNISYFVGMDAVQNHPQMFLCGDDNFAISGVPVKPGRLEFSAKTAITWADSRHELCGNIGLVDGSVKMVSLQSLREAIQNAGVATNRLAIP